MNFSRALLRLPLLVSDIFEPTHSAVGHGTRELAGGSSGHCGTDVVVERPLAGLLGLPRVGCGLALLEAANLRTPVLSGGVLNSDLGCGFVLKYLGTTSRHLGGAWSCKYARIGKTAQSLFTGWLLS